MTVAFQQLVHVQGASLRFAWPIQDQAFLLPIDLSGATGTLEVRGAPEDGVTLLNLSTTDGTLVIDPAAGLVTGRMPPSNATLAALAPGAYWVHLLVGLPGEPLNTVGEGVLTVSPLTAPSPFPPDVPRRTAAPGFVGANGSSDVLGGAIFG